MRQGDLFITKVESIPKEVRVIPDGILVYGEATGNSHRVVGGTGYKTKDGQLFVRVTKQGQIIHDKHKPIPLTKGVYLVTRQKEYTSGNMQKIVVD